MNRNRRYFFHLVSFVAAATGQLLRLGMDNGRLRIVGGPTLEP
jgi:hypothetical protein